MNSKEAQARIKINRLLEDAGWRFFDDENGEANIQLEPNVKIKKEDIDSLGENFEHVKKGFVDYLLIDDKKNPFVVVEAKKAGVHPLTAKEQARQYAISLRVKYIILTNGDIHYFWNIEKGNPEMITSYPSLKSLKGSRALVYSTDNLISYDVDKFLIAKSQEPNLMNTSEFLGGNDSEMVKYCLDNNLRVLRYYQENAIKSIQTAIKDGKTRFLFEMATGTGKTLTAAGVSKLFIRSEVANRILFLVDRIELENQAKKDLRKYLSKDGIKVAIYKEDKDDWASADIVISTIQSFSHDNKYKKIFSPTDFDLVISDEAHRSLGSSNRAILEYFLGYKLGLTATPKNYLKGVDFDKTDPRELEKRILLDTYQIFGCEGGNPTFSYTLNNGVKDGILVNPKIVDARTDITTQLLSDDGLILNIDNDDVEITIHAKDGSTKTVFNEKSYEKKFFSDSTNVVLCKTFMENALRDPISNEIGKSIIFCVNIEHARKVTEILNELAEKMYPGKYNSDFAVQITSNIPLAQEMTMSFANNNLNGKTRFLDNYDSSKTRVAVTVGMMTTGYDCPDILNLALFRPIFSPSEFIQIKGRGTRIHKFIYDDVVVNKEYFKLFDYFAVCEYFEKDFKYDEKIALPRKKNSNTSGTSDGDDVGAIIDYVVNKGTDFIKKLDNIEVFNEGMKIDRKFYQTFEDKIHADPIIQQYIENDEAGALEYYILNEIFDKPNEFYTIKKLERSLGLDRHLTIKEVVSKIMGKIKHYRTKKEILDDEFDNFVLLNKNEIEPYSEKIGNIRSLFQAYILDSDIRQAVKSQQYQRIITSPIKQDFIATKDITIKGMKLLNYISDYVIINDINCEKFS